MKQFYNSLSKYGILKINKTWRKKTMIWAPEETYSREEIQAIQLRKLKQTVAYIYEKVHGIKD